MSTTTAPNPGPSALRAATLCEAFQTTTREHAERTAIRTRGGNDEISFAEYGKRVRGAAAGLAALGLGRGDTLALMLTNRPEFHVVDTAAVHLGAASFSVYNTSPPDQIRHVVGDAGSRILVTEAAFLDRVLAVKKDLGLAHVVVVDDAPAGAIAWEDVVAAGDAAFDFEAAWHAVRPDDLCTLIYTSGTTGPPKGVQLTHANLMHLLRSLQDRLALPVGARVVSYLPMAHIGERNFSHNLQMLLGFEVTCCPDPATVASYLPEVRPEFFFSPPRLWEKMRAGLLAKLASEPDDDKRRHVQAAVEAGLRKVRAEQRAQVAGSSAEAVEELAPAYEQTLLGLRTALGFDQLALAATGAAPAPPEIVEFFNALGVPLIEGYGLSECSGVATANPERRNRIGTVGPALQDVELRLADDGEVLIRGANVMPGYRNSSEGAETIDADGWLHSGDIGELEEDGYLRIVDRKKELIVSAAGKNMSPANIEARLKSSSELIGQACCIGDRRPYNVALIVLDPVAAAAFAEARGLRDTSVEALSRDESVNTEVAEAVSRANEQLARVEQIKRFSVLPVDWLPDSDELTPTMKLKRRPVAEKYASEIEALYATS